MTLYHNQTVKFKDTIGYMVIHRNNNYKRIFFCNKKGLHIDESPSHILSWFDYIQPGDSGGSESVRRAYQFSQIPEMTYNRAYNITLDLIDEYGIEIIE